MQHPLDEQTMPSRVFTKGRATPVLLLVAYVAVLIKVMVFKDVPTIRVGHIMLNFSGTDGGHPANFVPLKTILPYLLGNKGLIIAGANLGGNIVPLVPIGFLASFVHRRMTWKRSLAVAIATGLSIETMQEVLRVGIFDVDDVILNSLGVMMGYWTFEFLAKWLRSRQYKNIVVAVVLLTVAATAAAYVVYPKDQRPIRFANGNSHSNTNLCGDTPGTGQIVGLGNHTLSLRRNDGVIQVIKLTERTTIKTSAGPASEADLKTGDRVTLVVLDRETATDVLVCSASGSS